MASYTTNLNLIKPADSDSYDVANDNGNMDKIDVWAGTTNTAIANQVQSRSVLSSPDVLSASIGAGLYYVTGATNVPTSGKAGYLSITERSGSNVLRVVQWQVYDSYNIYINMLQNNSTWTGWQQIIIGKPVYTWTDGTKPTLTNGSHYGNGCYYFKIGCFVYLTISAEFSSAPTNLNLFTLPAGYIPIGAVEIAVSGGGTYNAKAQCTVTSGGTVKVTSVDKWVMGSGIFLVGG